MDPCVTDGAELTRVHMVQLDFLRVPLYVLPSLFHLGIVYTVSQGPKAKNHELGNVIRRRGATCPLRESSSFFFLFWWLKGNLTAKHTGNMNWENTPSENLSAAFHGFWNKGQISNMASEALRVCQPFQHSVLPSLLTVLYPLVPCQKRPSSLCSESSLPHTQSRIFALFCFGAHWTWNNRLVPNRKRTTSRLYIITLLI